MVKNFCYDENERMSSLKLDIISFDVGQVNQRRQRMLREYGILSDCARILGVISKKFIEDHRKSKEKNFVEEVEKGVQIIYNLLSKACYN